MEAARTSEMSVDNYFTWQYIQEDNSELHTRRCENLKSHKLKLASFSFLTRLIAQEDFINPKECLENVYYVFFKIMNNF
jgi:hypothetical protein